MNEEAQVAAEEIEIEDVSSAVMAILDGEVKAPVYIDDLPDAVVDGVFVGGVGSYLVIEKWVTIAQKARWMGTALYRVTKVFSNGNLSLHDEELCQSAQVNWKTGPKYGWRFKLGLPDMSLTKRAKPEHIEKIKEKAAEALLPQVEGKKPRKVRNSSPEAVAAKKAKEDAIQKRREERLARREAKKAGVV